MKFRYNVIVCGEINAANKQEAIEKIKDIELDKYPEFSIEMEDEEDATNYIG